MVQQLVVWYNMGYRGAYDIELLIKSNCIYLNEINFRHSGNGALLIENGINAPYYWALDCVGKQIKDSVPSIKDDEYFMDIYMDFRYREALSIFEWLICLRKTHTYTIWSIKDPKPSFVYGGTILKRGIKKLIREIKKLQLKRGLSTKKKMSKRVDRKYAFCKSVTGRWECINLCKFFMAFVFYTYVWVFYTYIIIRSLDKYGMSSFIFTLIVSITLHYLMLNIPFI